MLHSNTTQVEKLAPLTTRSSSLSEQNKKLQNSIPKQAGYNPARLLFSTT